MTTLRLAVAAWAAQPQRARKEVRLDVESLIQQVNEYAYNDQHDGRAREYVKALHAAIALLRAAEKPAGKARRK